jgi:autotransporter-associated beta strand protein
VEGWKAGLEVRPVPAVALTGMWYEDERFLGSDWMFGARMEIPFEAGDLGDGKGMWGRIREAFTPRRRHLVERMAEPVHRQNAAIHIANTHKESSKVAQQSTSSSTQVVSQTKNKIVLGPGPSATNFSEVASGTLTLGAMSFSGGMSWHTTHIEGTLYSNQVGNSIFVPADGSPAVVMSTASISSQGGIGTAISFASNGVTHTSAGTLRLTSASVVNTTAGITLSSDVNMGSSFSINTGATINDGTLGGIVKFDSGTLTLSGINSYSQATVRSISIDSAGMVVGQPITGTGIPTGAVITRILDDSTIATTLNGAGSITLGTVISNGNLRVLTQTNGATTDLTLNSGTEVLTVSGVVSGTGALTKSGAGTLILSGTNTYTGATTVNAGTLVAASWGALGSQPNLVIRAVTGTGAIVLPTQNVTGTPPTSLTLENSMTINGASVAPGTYLISGGILHLSNTSIPLSGATITAPTTP